MNNNFGTVSVFGLGKLGLATAIHFASRGINTIGMDIRGRLVDTLNASIVKSSEPGLQASLAANRERFFATVSVSEAINNSTISFIIVPTPSLPSGGFSTEYVKTVADDIGLALKSKVAWHLIVLVSTVMPGSTRRDFIGALESRSGKKCGIDFGVCYNPEFIALGSVLENLAHPDYELIGESDERSGKQLEDFYSVMFSGGIPISRMNLENAELVKLGTNAFITMKISYANTLAAICEKIPELDVDIVTGAIGLDKRIGSRYLKGALGFGGPCFPRDNRALDKFAKEHSVDAALARATDSINHTQVNRLILRIIDLCEGSIHSKKITILGLSYKQNTNVIEESQALEIAIKLARLCRGQVTVFDETETLDTVRYIFKDEISYATSLTEATKDADIIIVAVADKRLIPKPESLKNHGIGVIMVDPWKLISRESLNDGTIYCAVGRQ